MHQNHIIARLKCGFKSINYLLSAHRELIPSSFPDPGCSGPLLLFDFVVDCCRYLASSSLDGNNDDDIGFLVYGLDIAAVDDEDGGLAA